MVASWAKKILVILKITCLIVFSYNSSEKIITITLNFNSDNL